MEKNPILKPNKNEKIFCKFVENSPFQKGMHDNEYGKREWYAYNLMVQKEGEFCEYTWFASKSVKKLIDIGQPKTDELVSIELCEFETKEGNMIMCWKLNDCTYNQLYNDQGKKLSRAEKATAPHDYGDELQKVINDISTIQSILKQHAGTMNNVIDAINELKENK